MEQPPKTPPELSPEEVTPRLRPMIREVRGSYLAEKKRVFSRRAKRALLAVLIGTGGASVVANEGGRALDYYHLNQELRALEETAESRQDVVKKVSSLRAKFGSHPSFLSASESTTGMVTQTRDFLKERKTKFSPFSFILGDEAQKDLGAVEVSQRVRESLRRESAPVSQGEHHMETGDIATATISGEPYLLPREKVDQIFRTFPESWTRDVFEVRQDNADSGDDDQRPDGLLGWKTIARCSHDEKGGKIIFTAFAKKIDKLLLVMDFLPHEVAHANDWEHDGKMSEEERADLLLAIVDRLASPDRFKSDYVEKIKNDDDPQEELYIKALEYWAEISKEFLMGKGNKLHIKDYALVAARIKATDPAYNVEEGAIDRLAAIGTISPEVAREAKERLHATENQP